MPNMAPKNRLKSPTTMFVNASLPGYAAEFRRSEINASMPMSKAKTGIAMKVGLIVDTGVILIFS